MSVFEVFLFPGFGLNTNSVQIRNRKTPNTDTPHAVYVAVISSNIILQKVHCLMLNVPKWSDLATDCKIINPVVPNAP